MYTFCKKIFYLIFHYLFFLIIRIFNLPLSIIANKNLITIKKIYNFGSKSAFLQN